MMHVWSISWFHLLADHLMFRYSLMKQVRTFKFGMVNMLPYMKDLSLVFSLLPNANVLNVARLCLFLCTLY